MDTETTVKKLLETNGFRVTKIKEQEEKSPNLKYYSIVDSRNEFIVNWFIQNAANKRILDYGCGSGQFSRKIAKFGALEFVGIDISEVSDIIAEKEAKAAGLQGRCKFLAMDAENMTF